MRGRPERMMSKNTVPVVITSSGGSSGPRESARGSKLQQRSQNSSEWVGWVIIEDSFRGASLLLPILPHGPSLTIGRGARVNCGIGQ